MKFMFESLEVHPDFQTPAAITMDVIPIGTQDITPETSQTIGAITSQIVNPQTYTSQSITYW